MSEKAQPVIFPSINGLRYFLVLSVVFHHFFLVKNPDTFFYSELKAISSLGPFAVRFFFVVSGFLIFHKMKFISARSQRPKLGFYLNRIFKILPLWWFTILLYFFFTKMKLQTVFLYATFTYGFFGFKMFFIPQAWSLFVEEIYYLFFPWLYRRLTSVKVSTFLFVAFYFVSTIWLRFAAAWGVPTDFWFIEFFPLACFHYFFLGITIYHLLNGGHFTKIDFIFKFRWIEIILVALLATLFFNYLYSAPELFISVMFVLFLNEHSLMYKLLSHRWFEHLGKTVYPIYLVHFLLIIEFDRWVRIEFVQQWLKNLHGFGFYLETLSLFFLVTGIGFLLWITIEKPMIQVGKKLENGLRI